MIYKIEYKYIIHYICVEYINLDYNNFNKYKRNYLMMRLVSRPRHNYLDDTAPSDLFFISI